VAIVISRKAIDCYVSKRPGLPGAITPKEKPGFWEKPGFSD